MDAGVVVFVAIVLLSLGGMYWAFKKPEAAFVRGWPRRIIALIIAVFIVLTVSSLSYWLLFIPYPLLCAVFLRKWIRRIPGTEPTRWWAVFLLVIPLLWVEEIFVILLYRGPFIGHMVSYFGFYVGLSLVFVLFRRLLFSFAQVMTIGGILGVIIEQHYKGPELLYQAITSGGAAAWSALIAFVPFTFGVYGLYLAAPYLLFYEELKTNSAHKWLLKSVIVQIALIVIPLATWAAWSFILRLFGITFTGVV